MVTDPTVNTIVSLSPEDKVTLENLKDKAYFTLARNYLPFFLGLVIVYNKMTPGYIRGRRFHDEMTMSDYKLVFWIMAFILGSVFLFFLIRDYRRRILPLQKEIQSATKYCIPFFARKYKDPLYNKCLLFYPGKEDYYIEITQDDFDAISNGENMHLEAACVTGEVLLLRSENRVCKQASEFSFSDDVIESSGNK